MFCDKVLYYKIKNIVGMQRNARGKQCKNLVAGAFRLHIVVVTVQSSEYVGRHGVSSL